MNINLTDVEIKKWERREKKQYILKNFDEIIDKKWKELRFWGDLKALKWLEMSLDSVNLSKEKYYLQG